MSTINSILRRVRSLPEAYRIRRFFKSPYQARVKEIHDLYLHANKIQSFDAYFAKPIDPEKFRSPYFDIIAAYASELGIASAMQVGCFGCQDTMFLAKSGYTGRQLASDFDPYRLAYMKKVLSADPDYRRVEFQVLNLESPQESDFGDIEMLFALAVLSNIQPEGCERLFAAIAKSSVKVCIFGDVYRPFSLTRSAGASSKPSRSMRNWFHPFLAIAARHGMNACFVPEFSDSDFRGVFIIHKGISQAIHQSALGRGFGNYIARQQNLRLEG